MKLPAKVVLSNNGTPQFEVKYKERTYRVKLFKFQENLPEGTPIDCTITRQANDQIFIRQNIKALAETFYNIGDTYDFIVRHDFSHNGYYELVDSRGLPFRIGVPKGSKLLTGSTVSCKVTGFDNSGAQLRLTDTSALLRPEDCEVKEDPEDKESESTELNAESLAERVSSELFDGNETDLRLPFLFSLLFINDDYYDLTVNRRLLDTLRNWHREGLDWNDIDQRLLRARRAIMYVLEGSTILLDEEPQRRKSLQQRLSILAGHVTGYHRAAGYLADGEQQPKIGRVLDSLKVAGYLYEAEKQLDMMMRMFSLSTDIMADNMGRIFSIMHERPEEFWHDEPFRKAFTRVLQIYVEQCRARIESGAGYDKETVRSLIEALSIQLLLAERESDADVFDYNLNLATLYRYASLLRTSVPENALRNAFLALVDVARRPSGVYRWSETGAHDLMASKLTASPVGLEESFEKWYTHRQVTLNITESGVTLSRSDVAKSDLKTIELPGVGVWQNLKVMTPDRISQPTTESDLRRARDMWGAIENQLFSEERILKRPSLRNLPRPERGDSCMIRVTHQIDESSFGVEVTDDDFQGTGRISMDDMVRYKVQGIGVQHFADPSGNPYIFLARVKNIDENGELIFSTFDYFVEYTHDQIENSAVMICCIKSSNVYGIVGISEYGDAVRFKREGLAAELKSGDIVKASYWTVPENKSVPYIDGAVIEVISNPHPFSTTEAFTSLIADFSGHQVYNAPEEEIEASSDTASGEDLLTDQRLTELMILVERKATYESNYMKAYNHIGFAHLLARMARDENRRALYEAWMRLISILHYFAVNGEVDEKQLAEFETNDKMRFDHHSDLYRRYLQLKIVSYKGKPQMRDEIWKYMSSADMELRGLATNVMAYNLIADSASASALGEIDDRINNILHVESKKSTLHSFGSEGKTKEFKTSLIFPPDNHMRANPDLQTLEIMKGLCALLNADGGTLYLGVNDYGMGVGIENDLAHSYFNGNEDAYDRYFRAAVRKYMGRDVDAYIDSKFETFGGKRIYVVSVQPYYTSPVRVEGVIYERHGSSKLPFRDAEDVRRFILRRNEQREEIKARQAQVRAEAMKEEDEKLLLIEEKRGSNATPKQNSTHSEDSSAPQFERGHESDSKKDPTAENPEKVATRHERPVCPASFDETADPATIRYLQIMKDGFMMVPEFYGYTDPDILLSLPLKEEDARKWLVLGYADGTVAKVAMKLFFNKEDYTGGKRFMQVPLVFADILADDEALVTISENKKGAAFIRADYPELLTEIGGMRSGGGRIFNNDQTRYEYDVLSGAKRLNYTDLFGRTSKDCGKALDLTGRDKVIRQLLADGFIKNT